MVTRTWAELLLLAALLATAWILVGHGPRPPAAASAAGRIPRGASHAADPVGDGLAERAARLRGYVASPPASRPVRRNPFVFPASPRAAATQVGAAVEPEPQVADARPELLLSGIAEDGANGAIVRTALIVAAGQLVFAKEGDRVLSRFVVLRIAADAVQLRDAERGEVFTLAFK